MVTTSVSRNSIRPSLAGSGGAETPWRDSVCGKTAFRICGIKDPPCRNTGGRRRPNARPFSRSPSHRPPTRRRVHPAPPLRRCAPDAATDRPPAAIARALLGPPAPIEGSAENARIGNRTLGTRCYRIGIGAGTRIVPGWLSGRIITGWNTSILGYLAFPATTLKFV